MTMAARLLLLAASLAATLALQNVSVITLSLSLNEEHSFIIDMSTEYILSFTPDSFQSQWPSRLWVSSDGGDTTYPLLVTARLRTGASTWQLPYYLDDRLLTELERTLCPDDTADPSDSDCAGENLGRGALVVHLSSWCSRPLAVSLRVSLATDWPLALHRSTHVSVALARPRVYYYGWAEGQHSARLVAAADDAACATLAVHNYTCPIAQTLSELGVASLRMTLQRSAGTQLARSRYPRGFYVVVVVHGSDEQCSGEPAADGDWLWEAALGEPPANDTGDLAPRTKELTITIMPALTRSQYAVALSATLAVFLAFYLAAGAAVAAQRWPACARLVRPPPPAAHTESEADVQDSSTGPGSPRRRRRESTATFDSSDNSDTESEGAGDAEAPPASRGAGSAVEAGAVPAAVVIADNGQVDSSAPGQGARPFGLPARLRVAALARRRARVLRARSDRYLYTLYTVAVFYALPVVQFVAAFQIILNVSGSLDLCYYNFLCAHPAGALSDFNHVVSNVGYLLLGALFLLQLRRRRRRRKTRPRHEEYGIPAHDGLLSSLGAGMMVVALLSASYHVCPNQLNFQFDTAFMYVLAVLSMVKIYQSRHPDINARAHVTFGVLAVLIALVVWGVLGGGPVFWALFTVLHLFTFLLLSLRIYYVGQFRLGKAGWEAARGLRWRRGERPLYSARLVLLLIANALNWLFALFGLLNQSADFASHLLNLLLGNTLMYMIFYLVMKLLHGERLRWYSWLFLALAAACWAPGLYFFTSGSSDWSATPAQSRHLNHECRLLQFYDAHDLWHLLSAAALYFSFNAMLTWDDGLSSVKRTDIAVF